jgi:hypothetical protein
MEIEMGKKVCTKCNKEKNLTEYHKEGNGHRPDCKECRKAYKKKYYQENSEKVKARHKKYYQENLEKVRARVKKYREENSEEIKAYSKKYREDNPEKVKARKKKYYQENLEKVKAYKKKYYQENSEKVRARKKKYRQENLEKVRARVKKYRQENPEKRRLARAKRRAQKINTQVEDITDKLLNEHWVKNNIDPERCHYCDEGLYEHLEHCIPLSRGGTHTKENLVPSCAPCNLSKGNKTPDEWDKYRGL